MQTNIFMANEKQEQQQQLQQQLKWKKKSTWSYLASSMTHRMLIPEHPRLILPSIPLSLVLMWCKKNSKVWNKLFLPGLISNLSLPSNCKIKCGGLCVVCNMMMLRFEVWVSWALCALLKCLVLSPGLLINSGGIMDLLIFSGNWSFLGVTSGNFT